MAEAGVACNVHYKPLPMMTAYKNMGFDIKDYPNAYKRFENEITLPLHTKLTDEEVAKFVSNLVSMGHESPIEHVTFTFGIEGISRSCSHQIVRHRIASFSQQSQRYVKLDQFEYIIPPEI